MKSLKFHANPEMEVPESLLVYTPRAIDSMSVILTKNE
jgi:hypothetical protein